METINIYGANRFNEVTKVRDACRGIVIQNGMILLTYEVIPISGLSLVAVWKEKKPSNNAAFGSWQKKRDLS